MAVAVNDLLAPMFSADGRACVLGKATPAVTAGDMLVAVLTADGRRAAVKALPVTTLDQKGFAALTADGKRADVTFEIPTPPPTPTLPAGTGIFILTGMPAWLHISRLRLFIRVSPDVYGIWPPRPGIDWIKIYADAALVYHAPFVSLTEEWMNASDIATGYPADPVTCVDGWAVNGRYPASANAAARWYDPMHIPLPNMPTSVTLEYKARVAPQAGSMVDCGFNYGLDSWGKKVGVASGDGWATVYGYSLPTPYGVFPHVDEAVIRLRMSVGQNTLFVNDTLIMTDRRPLYEILLANW